MFDTRLVGKKIMELRKEKNLTQMNLADALGVSYQAVSNWERGNSMPDISKLPEIAEVLGCSIDHLLGASKETTIVKEIIEEPEKKVEIESLKELKEIAPLIQPKKLDDILDGYMDENPQTNLNELYDVAPFVSSQYLDDLVRTVDLKDDIEDIVNIAPFLSEKALRSIADELLAKNDINQFVAILPFMSNDYIDVKVISHSRLFRGLYTEVFPFISSEVGDVLIDKMIEDQNYRDIEDVIPFLNQVTLNKLVDAKVIDFNSTLPFISSDKLKELADASIRAKDFDTLIAYAPFLENKDLDQIVEDNMTNLVNGTIEGLYPFMSQTMLSTIAEKIIKEKGIKGLSGIAPFL